MIRGYMSFLKVLGEAMATEWPCALHLGLCN
jgi:hypothetical protein